MLTEPLSFTGTLTLQDCLDINRYHFRRVLRWRFRILLALITVPATALFIFDGFHRGFTVSNLFFGAICLYFPVGWMIHRRLAVPWRYHRNRHLFIECTATITDYDVTVSNVNSDLRLNWNFGGSIISTPRGLLFLLPRNIVWFWLPERLFEGNDHKQAILALAAEHRVPIQHMS